MNASKKKPLPLESPAACGGDIYFAIVTLVAMQAENNQTKLFTTGSYEIAVLEPGNYKVTVSSPSFAMFSSDELVIKAGQSIQLGILLKEHEMTELVGTVSIETRSQRVRRNVSRILLFPYQKIKNSFGR